MPRQKVVRLSKRKHSGTPAHRLRDAQTMLNRQLHNASLKYECSVSSLKDCKVVLKKLHLPVGRLLQNIQFNDVQCAIMRPRVLSLFDGISCGLVSLNQLGIIPECYFSSEIDVHCKLIQRFNFGDQVVQLGDIRSLHSQKLREIGPIDLLFGGSPCNDFSGANPNRRGLYDEAGSGVLFFEFLRVHLYFQNLAHLQNRADKYKWFFENVCSMSNETKDEISRHLGRQPIKLCSSQWTGMRRQRYFWTNILTNEDERELLQSSSSGTREINLQRFLCGSGRTAEVKLLPTFTSNLTNLTKGGRVPVLDKDLGPGFPYFSEVERLMGLPVNFTAGPNTPLHIRKKVLAKAWDVHTVKSLIQPITQALVV